MQDPNFKPDELKAETAEQESAAQDQAMDAETEDGAEAAEAQG